MGNNRDVEKLIEAAWLTRTLEEQDRLMQEAYALHMRNQISRLPSLFRRRYRGPTSSRFFRRLPALNLKRLLSRNARTPDPFRPHAQGGDAARIQR
jgi:hypothetical protein